MNQTLPSFAGRALSIALLPLLMLLNACAAPLAPVKGAAGGGKTLLARAEPVAIAATVEVVPAAAEVAPPAVEVAAVEMAAVEEPAPRRECPVEGARVLLIGDSLSAGLAPVMAQHARACGASFHHKGVVGSHVTQWAHDSWLVPELRRAEPTVVIVSLGGNDFGRRDDANVRAGVAALVSKVRATGAKLLWISPPTMPFADRVGARAMWQEAIGGEKGRDWFATEELVIHRTEDRIHPTRSEYRALGATLWQWLSTQS
jgi:hypothetical protein